LFTGLIAERGEVTVLERDASGATVRIAARIAGELEPGDSIAVNGVCLTAIAVGDGGFEAQAVKETLERTTLGALMVGSAVNLEAPLRADERLGGHIVQGHVDGVGRILAIREEGFSKVLTIALAPALARYVVEKGSVAVDGVSLTVSALDDASFSVALVPETLQRTTLGRVAVGDRVNLELDILAKYVERLLAGRASTS
jgi:riboflavin synthase